MVPPGRSGVLWLFVVVVAGCITFEVPESSSAASLMVAGARVLGLTLSFHLGMSDLCHFSRRGSFHPKITWSVYNDCHSTLPCFARDTCLVAIINMSMHFVAVEKFLL